MKWHRKTKFQVVFINGNGAKMSLIKRKTVKVSKGQIAPDLIERTEIGILDISCQEMTNWINTKYGAIKTVDGSDLKYTFGANKKVKILKVTLQNNKEGLIALNGTDGEITVFDPNAIIERNKRLQCKDCTESRLDFAMPRQPADYQD